MGSVLNSYKANVPMRLSSMTACFITACPSMIYSSYFTYDYATMLTLHNTELIFTYHGNK